MTNTKSANNSLISQISSLLLHLGPTAAIAVQRSLRIEHPSAEGKGNSINYSSHANVLLVLVSRYITFLNSEASENEEYLQLTFGNLNDLACVSETTLPKVIKSLSDDGYITYKLTGNRRYYFSVNLEKVVPLLEDSLFRQFVVENNIVPADEKTSNTMKQKGKEYIEATEEIMSLNSSNKENYKEQIIKIRDTYGYTEEDAYLIKALNTAYPDVMITRADYLTIRKYFGGADLTVSKTDVENILKSREEYTELCTGFASSSFTGEVITMAIRNAERHYGSKTYRDFNKKAEEVKTPEAEVKIDTTEEERNNPIRRRMFG